ncbi:hypothetical protein C8A00DRAFT_17072 [Chaetomidium leptoderma]|uniref:Uncharacterized protein n=1 Tax=Chaetomidium leptoderma TaxID=669021 RepID=A0AAN6VHT7_9PEZI|nr:hypothetical protein C8A00DRAFT_17072 [Chaetomidium leptoderma]
MPSLSTLLAAQDEDQLLNGIWIGLLSVEALMVLGVALRGLVGAVASSRFFEERRQRRRRSSVGMGMGSVVAGGGGVY